MNIINFFFSLLILMIIVFIFRVILEKGGLIFLISFIKGEVGMLI